MGRQIELFLLNYFLATFVSVYTTFVPVFEIQAFALRL